MWKRVHVSFVVFSGSTEVCLMWRWNCTPKLSPGIVVPSLTESVRAQVLGNGNFPKVRLKKINVIESHRKYSISWKELLKLAFFVCQSDVRSGKLKADTNCLILFSLKFEVNISLLESEELYMCLTEEMFQFLGPGLCLFVSWALSYGVLTHHARSLTILCEKSWRNFIFTFLVFHKCFLKYLKGTCNCSQVSEWPHCWRV